LGLFVSSMSLLGVMEKGGGVERGGGWGFGNVIGWKAVFLFSGESVKFKR